MNKTSNLVILIFLGIIWSTFSIFTKISAEVFSPFFVAFARLFLGGIFIYCACLIQNKKIFISKNFKYYTIVGFFNSALPFTLFAMSSKALDSSVVAILDGTVPMFEVLISIFILQRKVDKNAIFGVILGIIGVIITSFSGSSNLSITWSQAVAVIAILIATASYAAASLYINAKCQHIDSITMAGGSVIFAAIILCPSLFFIDYNLFSEKVTFSLLGLGLLCTGIAYIFYFKLAAEESARAVVSVVLLIPVFGTIFGTIFLHEQVTANKIIGCLTILASMKFILNLSFVKFWRSNLASSENN